MVVADEPAAGREGGFDSGNGIVVRNSQIKMNSVALRARFVHLLGPVQTGPPADESTRSAGAGTWSYPSTAFQNGRTAGMSVASIAIASD